MVNIVVCQKSKIDDWVEHFGTYYPDYQVLNLTKKTQAIMFRNQLAVMEKGLPGSYKPMVGIINYELTFRRDWLLKIRKDYTLMLDESSLITNETAHRSKFILKMHPESVVLLSGTPTAGKYEKLWSQCKLLGWNITKEAFWSSYVETTWIDGGNGYKNEVITGYKNVDHLKRKLHEHGALFVKTDEVMTLPDQVEQIIHVEPTREYKKFMKNSYLKLEDGTELVGDNSLTKILHARQLCGQYHKDKLQAFRDLVESTEDRLIVFYNFNAELDQLRMIANDLNRPHGAVNGQQRNLKPYEESDNSITFVQYQAGAMGGNYQKANKIIYFTLPLGKGSCDMWEQSKKRIHRIGQEQTCFYYYLLVKNSFEEKNLESLREGKELTDELFKKET